MVCSGKGLCEGWPGTRKLTQMHATLRNWGGQGREARFGCFLVKERRKREPRRPEAPAKSQGFAETATKPETGQASATGALQSPEELPGGRDSWGLEAAPGTALSAASLPQSPAPMAPAPQRTRPQTPPPGLWGPALTPGAVRASAQVRFSDLHGHFGLAARRSRGRDAARGRGGPLDCRILPGPGLALPRDP